MKELKNFRKYLNKEVLNESAPGYDTRKTGEPLPTLESVKAAYEAKIVKEIEYTLDSLSQDEYGKNYDDLDPEQQRYMRSELEITKGYPFSAGIDQDGYRLPEFPDPIKNMNEGVWSVLPDRIPEFIQKIKDIKDEYHGVVGSDDVYDGLDRAITAAEELLNMELKEE